MGKESATTRLLSWGAGKQHWTAVFVEGSYGWGGLWRAVESWGDSGCMKTCMSDGHRRTVRRTKRRPRRSGEQSFRRTVIGNVNKGKELALACYPPPLPSFIILGLQTLPFVWFKKRSKKPSMGRMGVKSFFFLCAGWMSWGWWDIGKRAEKSRLV